MLNIKMRTIPGWEKTFIESSDPSLGTLGAINHDLFVSNRNSKYSAEDLYAIADAMNSATSKPTITELFDAHTELLEKNRRLRNRVSELMEELGRTAEDI